MLQSSKEYRLCIYRRILYAALAFGLVVTFLSIYISMWFRMPSTIMVKAGVDQKLDFHLPASGKLYRDNSQVVAENGIAGKYQSTATVDGNSIPVNLNNPVTVKASQVDTYKLSLKLFGVLPFKEVHVEVIEDRKLKPIGLPIGIYVKTKGVLVVGVGDFEGEGGKKEYPAKYVFQPGDYILEMNDEIITEKKQLMEKISHSNGQESVFKICRGGQELMIKAKPMPNQNGEYKMGIWIRDNAQGVGTMTYVDENGCFGALGHGINDVDTGNLMEIAEGTLYHTEIISIKKGSSGDPGELTGFIEYDDTNVFGAITGNSQRGVFGICDPKIIEESDAEYLPIALKQDIRLGEATVICSLGDYVKSYEAEIVDIHLENDNVNRGIVIEITDPELLARTGGIVQGMSGSPIIQDGKIVGAVTHVLVNDPTRGYGIFIENMLEH